MLIESPTVACDTPLTFNVIGYDWPQRAVDRSQHGHAHYDWLQTIDGSGTIEIDGKTFTLHPGQGILFHPGIKHRYAPAPEGWHTAFLAFSGTIAAELTNQLGLDHYLVFPELSPALAGFIKLHAPAFNQDTPDARVEQATAVFRFLMLLKQNCHVTDSFYVQSLYAPLINYITTHYQQAITNGDLCALTGYSAPYQTKIFREYYGVTPLQYLNNFRLRKAKALLLTHEDWQVQDVAEASGFTDISRFIHDFKQLTGYTPLKYRNSHQFG